MPPSVQHRYNPAVSRPARSRIRSNGQCSQPAAIPDGAAGGPPMLALSLPQVAGGRAQRRNYREPAGAR